MDNKKQVPEEQIKQNSSKKDQFKTDMVGTMFVLVFIGSIMGICAFVEKGKDDHLNVVIENKDGKLLVEDVNTKEQRIVKLRNSAVNPKDQQYIFPGDTINVKQVEEVYKAGKIVDANNSSITVNRDSIWVRKQRALFDAEKQKMMNQR